jgi:hypothetical protein
VLADVQKRVDDVAVAADRLARHRAVAATPPPAPPTHVTASLAPGALDPLLKQIAEIRELSLLTDVERKERLTNMEHERKRMLVRQVIEHMEQNRWSAERARSIRWIASILKTPRQSAFDINSRKPVATPSRPRSRAGREQVETTSASARGTRRSGPPSSSSMTSPATSRPPDCWRAFNASATCMLRLPSRAWSRKFATTSTADSGGVRLQHAQRLVDRFPDHPKTARIKEQLATLQQNAEIEERQELEVRIQELIRGHKFHDAIELSEELLNRFPQSPQAEAIEKLLPRIRELANEHKRAGGVESLVLCFTRM